MGARLPHPMTPPTRENRSDRCRMTGALGRPRGRDATALDVLRNEDRALLRLFDQIRETRGPSVSERWSHGNFAKRLIRRVAVREAGLMDVLSGIRDVAELGTVAHRLSLDSMQRRKLIDEVERMARGKQGMYLNLGQDFEGPLNELMGLMSSDIEWELSEAIPVIERTVSREATTRFRSARYVVRHAPTYLNPSGRRWYEHAPVISRILTTFTRLRDYPRAARGERAS
jgi:hypothetical protein